MPWLIGNILNMGLEKLNMYLNTLLNCSAEPHTGRAVQHPEVQAGRSQGPQVRALSYHRALARSKGAAGHGSDISTRAEHKPSCVSHTMLYGGCR